MAINNENRDDKNIINENRKININDITIIIVISIINIKDVFN